MDYKNYYIIKSTPDQVYLGLTNPLTIHLWSGEEAEMEDKEGSEFSLFEGSIVGRNIELVAGKKIVQQWYFGDDEPESIVTIKLHPKGENTSLELRHINIPDNDFDDIVEGWNDMYMNRLMEFYDE
jgi:activator of HSP90 ATPase